MRPIWLFGLVIVALVAPALASAQVETATGSLSLGGKLKWLYVYKAADEDAKGAAALGQRHGFDGIGIEQFMTTNVELDLNGTIGENLAYVIELQASLYGLSAGANTVGMWGTPSFGEINGSRLGIRQAKLVINDIIPSTRVNLGSFNLPVGIYQRRATNDWDLINLPLINIFRFGPAVPRVTGGTLPAFTPLGMGWQATGVMFDVVPHEMIEINLAYFNGYAYQNVNFDGSVGPGGAAVADLEKSWLLNFSVKPVEGALISLAYLSEGWQEDWKHNGHTEQQRMDGWVFSAGYVTDQLELSFDYMTMTAPDYVTTNRGLYGPWTWDPVNLVWVSAPGKDREADLNWKGMQLTAGFWVTEQIELLARYDWIDPDTGNGQRFVGPDPALANSPGPVPAVTDVGHFSRVSRYDALSFFTLGLNYRLNENSEVAANYIWIQEQGTPFDTKKTGANSDKRQQLNNDTLMIQVQLWQ